MDLIKIIQGSHNYWKLQIIKIIPEKFLHTIRKITFIAMILMLFFIINPLPNYEFYHEKIIGKVEKIEREPKNWNIKVDSNWYFVQMGNIELIEVGHKIAKQPESWLFTVYDSIGNTIYQDSSKTPTFKLIKNKRR